MIRVSERLRACELPSVTCVTDASPRGLGLMGWRETEGHVRTCHEAEGRLDSVSVKRGP